MENKHNSWELAQYQALPLECKINMTKQRIEEWYNLYWNDGGIYVSISGGKDSQVLAHIVKEMYPDVPLVFCNTGLELNSVRQKAMSMASEVLYPKKSFKQVIIEYGYPVISKEIAHKISDARSAAKHGHESYVTKQFEGTYVSKNGKSNMIDIQKYKYLLDAPFRISHLCCNFTKKAPARLYEKETGRKPVIGTLAEESALRLSSWMQKGCLDGDSKRPSARPLSFWTEQDILEYIKKYDLQIAKEAYGDVMYCDDEGFFYESPFVTDGLKLSTTKADRTGCAFCMFGIQYDTDRFIRLKNDDIRKYNFVMNGGKFDGEGMWIPSDEGLGMRFVIDWLNEHGGLKIKY